MTTLAATKKLLPTRKTQDEYEKALIEYLETRGARVEIKTWGFGKNKRRALKIVSNG